MKKIVSLLAIFTIIFCVASYSYAADEYSFELKYTGTIVQGEEKNATINLVGKNGTLHEKVRVKIDIQGPGKPKIIAIDEKKQEHDITDVGYWGPAAGFAIQGDFTNVTPIKVTYPKAGKYTTTLTLIDLENNNTPITTKTFEINVEPKAQQPDNNTNVDNTVTNETNITQLPQTGRSIWEYMLYFVGTVVVISVISIYVNNKRITNE